MSSDVVCQVQPPSRIPHPHPLATRTGAEALLRMFEADRHWRPLTTRCRDALRTAYTRALQQAIADGVETIPLPALPDDTHPATLRALVRRGLAEDGRLTPLAVEVVRWAYLGEKRPITTAPTKGGLL